MHSPRTDARNAAITLCATLLLACSGDPAQPDDRRFAPTEAAVLSIGNPGKDEDPAPLRARDGSLYVAWFSDRTAPGDIYITRSQHGSEWSTAVRVTNSTGGDFNPSLIQDAQGTFHLAWFRWTAPFVGHIWYNRSADGITWDPANEVQVTTGTNFDDWVPTLVEAPDGGLVIYFASAKRTTSTSITDLFFSRRAPGQTSWSAPAPVSVNSAGEHDHLPYALRLGSQIALVWERHDTSQPLPWLNTKSDVYFATSSDGVAWSAPVKVTNEPGRVVNLFPGIYQTESQGPRLTWLSTRSGGADVFELSTAQVGQYPNGVTRVSEVGGGYSHRVVWTAVPGVYLGVWVGGPEGSQEIWYRFFER